MSDKLTPEQIAAIRERLEESIGRDTEMDYTGASWYENDIAALLAHVAALEAENAALRKVADAAVEMDYWIDDLTGAKDTVDVFKAAIAAYTQDADHD